MLKFHRFDLPINAAASSEAMLHRRSALNMETLKIIGYDLFSAAHTNYQVALALV